MLCRSRTPTPASPAARRANALKLSGSRRERCRVCVALHPLKRGHYAIDLPEKPIRAERCSGWPQTGAKHAKSIRGHEAGMCHRIIEIGQALRKRAKQHPRPQARMCHGIKEIGQKLGKNTRKKHPHPKAGMSHGISDISQKGGLDRKLECPLESAKRGLHRIRESRTFGSEYAWKSTEIGREFTVRRPPERGHPCPPPRTAVLRR